MRPRVSPRLLQFAIVLATSVYGQDFPDVTKGQIDGKTALYVMALSGVEDVPGAGAKFDRILSLNGCEVHLAPTGDLERELLFPCSKWVLPPPGRYRVWLESPAQISGGYGVLLWDGEPFEGRGMVLGMALEPAGKVALAPGIPLGSGRSFRLVHLRTSQKGVLKRVFDRRVAPALARQGASVMIGQVLSGIFDAKTGEAIALARPALVAAGKTTWVSPSPPVEGSDVMAVLDRPREATASQDELLLALDVDGKVRRPDVFIPAADRVIAVWFSVHGRRASMRAESRTLRLGPVDLLLKPGKVITYRGNLGLLPSLALSIVAPAEGLASTEIRAEIRSRDSSETVQRTAVVSEGHHRFDLLPAEPLDVVLRFGPWQFRQTVDLSSGLDRDVIFQLDPYVVSGTVYHGRDAAPRAGVAFHADTDWVRLETDDSGRYEAVLWRHDDYVAEITVGSDAPPFIEGPFEVKQTATIDFHVPRTKFVVDVRDAVTGRPVAGARVIAGSNSKHGEGDRKVVQTAVTDERGRATLPPVRQGAISIQARADGYFDSEATRDVVERIDAEGHYEIALRPVGETVRVRVSAAPDRPAANAEIWAVVHASGNQPPLWRGTTDARGVAAIPRSVGHAIFLVRTLDSGCAIRRLGSSNEEVLWTIPPGAPLTVRLDRPVRLAVQIDGTWVSGAALAFLTRSLDASGMDGVWTAGALPAQPLRLLAWREARRLIESGAFDSVAKTVFYPWPPVVELRPVD